MANSGEMLSALEAGSLDEKLAAVYGGGEQAALRERIAQAVRAFEELYGTGREVRVYSVPGRTELCGNHTDHQNGLVMAAAIGLDIIAVAAKSEGGAIRVTSEGFCKEDVVDLARLTPQAEEHSHSASLVRGVAAGIAELGGALGGFDAYTTSDVPRGGGLSSSAAFEVCMGLVLSDLYNEGRFTPVQLAQVGQMAENKFFGKPSGLMDQLACAVGGAVMIDFEDPARPKVESHPLELEKLGFVLAITSTGASHADLTHEYALVQQEMEQVAHYFGKDVLRQVDPAALLDNVAALRKAVGDRAILRSIHFFAECGRVLQFARAVREEDARTLLAVMVESGQSSFMYNQNAYSCDSPEQDVPLALALSENFLEGEGAWRLQGGGFAGTIQALVPTGQAGEYCRMLEGVFGPGACRPLSIRNTGAVRVL